MVVGGATGSARSGGCVVVGGATGSARSGGCVVVGGATGSAQSGGCVVVGGATGSGDVLHSSYEAIIHTCALCFSASIYLSTTEKELTRHLGDTRTLHVHRVGGARPDPARALQLH